MKTTLRNWALSGATGLLLLLLPGCYTQMATKGEDERDEGGYASQGQYQDSTYSQNNREDYDDYNGAGNWHHPYVGFSYYYPSCYWPSYAFSAAYCDPFWGFGFGYGYGSGFYGNPFYSYYSPFYTPYYSPYGYYGYGYGHSYALVPVHRGSRSFGSTRGVTGGRGSTIDTHTDVAPPNTGRTNEARGGYNLPTGAALGGSATGSSGHTTAAPAAGPRTVGSQKGSPSPARGTGKATNGPSNPTVRGWGGRRSSGQGRGDTQPRYGGNDQTHSTPSTPPARTNQGQGHGGRDSGSVRSGGSSSPRPSGGGGGSPSGGGRGSSSSSGGGRGGNSRGGRP